MDNITHTLVGVLIGEAAAQVARPGGSGLPVDARRNVLVAVGVIGSNLPDADIVLTAFGGDRLDYMLEHRGYTHTIVGAVIAAAALLALSAAWLRWRGWRPSRLDYAWLAGLALAAALLHLAMDYSNSYGVHPFWPLFNGWFYGDAVFIIEPLLWACAAPLVFVVRSGLARSLMALTLAAALLLSYFSGLVAPGAALLVTALTAVMLAIGRWCRPGWAVTASLGAWFAITAAFVAASHVAAQRVQALAAARFPHALTIDDVLTPAPANPLCWELLLVQLEGERYTVRRGMLSLAARAMPVAQCRGLRLAAATTAPLEAVPDRGASFLHWYGQFTMRRGEIARLAAADCEAAAFLRFARAPWAAPQAAHWLVGDLRFDRGPRPGFAELRLTGRSHDCDHHAVPWLPPRAELLH